MDDKELQSILDLHKKWIYSEEGGERANLRYADLRGANLCDANLCDANLRDADLRYANLRGANLRGANLYDANLRGANLCDANLCDANLRDADLRYANLRGANLRGANLYDANLSGANLSGANLSGANLSGANLYDANLRGANLRGANLYDANLSGANLSGAKNAELVMARTTILPEGTIIGYKKASWRIVKLEIPEDAKRSNASGRKCRCDKAKVLSIESCDGKEAFEEAASSHDRAFVYRVGETVSVDDFCEDRWDECAPGIHFFITRTEAEEY